MLKTIGKFVAGRIAQALAPRDQRIAQLEARIAALEARPVLEYDDVWEPNKSYRVGQFVTFRGSLWAYRATTTEARPGTNKDWRLAVKRGKNARWAA